MTLALAQSSLPEDQIARASTVLARYFDLPPQWFFPSLGRVPGPQGAPMRLFADPESGQAISLATARRLLRAHEDEVLDRMLHEALVQPVQLPGVPSGVVGYEQVSAKRVAETVRAMAPLRAEDLPFKVAFAMALDMAASDVDVRAFAANLAVTARLEGLSPILAAEIARRGAAAGQVFRSPYDVASFIAPGAAGGIQAAKVGPTAEQVAAKRAEVAAAAASGKPIPATLEEVGGAPAEAVLGREIVGGLTMPGDFLASLKEAETNYVKAGEQIANQIKIPFSDSWAGKAVGTLLDYSFRPLDAAWRVVSDPNVVLAPFGHEESVTGRYNIEEGLKDAWDIIRGRTTAMEELQEDIGAPPWLTMTGELFVGFGRFSLDPIQQAFNLASVSRGRRLIVGLSEAGKPEEWVTKVDAFLNQPVRRIGDLRNLTVSQYLIREASRTEDPARYFARAVDNFRAYFGSEGIHPLVAERVWRFVRSAKKLNMSDAEVEQGIQSVLLAALGIKPPPNSLAAQIGRHVEEIRARTSQQLPLFLADGARYEARTTRLSRDAANALGALNDSYLDLATRGPRMLEIPHRAGPITRAEHALRISGLGDTGLGKVIRSTLSMSPRVQGAHLEIGIEQGAEAVTDFRRALLRAQVFTPEEIETARLQITHAMRPENPIREVEFVKVIDRYNRSMLERISTAYGLSEVQTEQIMARLEDKLGKGTAGRPRVFAAFREGVDETLVRSPILPSQAVNSWQMVDPVIFRRGIAETIGTWRKWRAAHYRAFGMAPPAARHVAVPMRAFVDGAMDLLVRDLFLSWFKPLVVLRPAYVLRVVGLEEQSRFLATLGLARRLQSGKILTGERLAEMEGLPGRVGAALAERRAIDMNIPELADFGVDPILHFQRPGFLPDEALANTLTSRFAMASPGPVERAIRESLSPDAWGAIERGSPHFYDWWYNALGHQFGLDPVGRRYLDDIARGVPEEESVRRGIEFLTSPGDGLRFAKRIMGPEYTREALELQIRRGVRYARDLTGEHPNLAAAARDGVLEPAMLRAVPTGQQPILVHGPMVSESVLARVGPLKRGRDFVARWIVQQPTNRLSRQPYFKAWYDRIHRSLIETARAQGVQITPELLQGFHDSAREFAVGQVRRIMFDFTREGRIDQLTRYFLMFVQPFLEFPVVWSRIIRQNPATLWHFVRMGRAALQSGFLHQDPETGELSVPLSWWAGAAPLLAAVTGGQLRPLGSGGGWELSVPLTSFNLFAQSTFQLPTGGIAGELPIVMPAFNPEAMFILQRLVSGVPLRADIKSRISSWLFQYGPVDPSRPGSLLPAYMHHGLAALMPEWFKAETDLQTSHFLLLQQAMGLEPDPELARAQASKFAGLRAFFAAFFPGAPRINFPTAELEQEWRSYVDQGPDYSTARERFLEAHPGLDLIVIARTMWAEENLSPIPIPASQAVSQLLTTKGAKAFAAKHPSWVWAIIPHELREGTLDIGSFFAQIASGQRVVLTPEQFLAKASVQKGWDAYFALREGWVAWTEAHPEIGEGDPSYDEEYADFAAARDHIAETNPAWAAEYRTFELGGVEPRVMAEARNLAKNDLFGQTQVGHWLIDYFTLRDKTAADMAKAGIHSIRTKTAERLGITARYDTGVEALNAQYPDGATAYRLFFSRDLEHQLTPGDRKLDAIPEEIFDERITPWWTQFEILRDGPNQAPTEGARSEAFNAIRAYVELAYHNFSPKENPLILRWATADPTWQQDYLVSLVGRPYAYLNRFDKTYLLKNPTNDATEKLWTLYAQARGLIAEREATDPEFSSTAAYEALGLWVATEATKNKQFATQVAGANQWGYQFGRLLERPDTARALYGSPPKYAMPYWRGFLDAVGEVQRVVDAAKLGGSFDPRAKVTYNVLRGELLRYVGTLKEASVEFAQQWDFLEEASATDPLISYFMPEFSSYFGPIQGYPGGPR